MFDKILEAQQKADAVRTRLDGITVTGMSEAGKITVHATGNKEIKSVVIDAEFLQETDKEGLEELLVIAINNALSQAENLHQTEMASMAKEMLGGLGGLGNLFNK